MNVMMLPYSDGFEKKLLKRKRPFTMVSKMPKKKRKKKRVDDDPDYVYPDFSEKNQSKESTIDRKRKRDSKKTKKQRVRRKKERRSEDKNPKNFTVIRKKGKQYMKQCTCCGAKSPPCWRKGPKGVGSLCNACGLRWKNKRLILNLNTGGKENDVAFPPLIPLKNEIVVDVESDSTSDSSDSPDEDVDKHVIRNRRRPRKRMDGRMRPPMRRFLQNRGPTPYFEHHNRVFHNRRMDHEELENEVFQLPRMRNTLVGNNFKNMFGSFTMRSVGIQCDMGKK